MADTKYWVGKEEKLKELYENGSWTELRETFPEKNDKAIARAANRRGFKRIALDGWSDKLDDLLRKGFEESQKLSTEDRKRLKFKIITDINRAAKNQNLRQKKWDAILKRAQKIDLVWGPRKEGNEENDDGIGVNLWDEDILLAFLIEKRNAKELEKHFNESLKQIEKKLPEKIGKYRLISYRNMAGNKSFYYHEIVKIGSLEERAWTPIEPVNEEGAKDDGSILIKFPAEIDWRQIRVFPLASAFYGSRLHDSKRFDDYKKLVAREPYHFLIMNGGFFPEKIVGKAEEKIERVMMLEDELTQYLAPIAHKILWAIQGEPEEKIEHTLGIDPLKAVCTRLKIPYFKRPVMAEIVWGKAHFSFYCIYGTTNAKQQGAMINAVANLLDQFEATDFIVMSKQKSGMENIMLRIIRDRINCCLVDKHQHLVTVPGLKKYEGSKEEKKGQAIPIGGSCAMILFPDGGTAFSD